MKKYTLYILLLCLALPVFSQTPGLIYKPANSTGAAILDPNGDGYTSATMVGFIADDALESEIPYVPIPQPEIEPANDLALGADCGNTDLVDTGDEETWYNYLDGSNNWLFRVRLGATATNSVGYALFIDTDAKFGFTGPNADPNAVPDNPGFEIEVNLQTNFGVAIYDIDGTTAGTEIGDAETDRPYDTHCQKSVALTTNCGDPDYFYDFYLPFQVLIDNFGITTSTPLRMVFFTILNSDMGMGNNALSDLGGVDDASYGYNYDLLFEKIIDNQTPTGAVDMNTAFPDRSDCPMINAPIIQGSTSIGGTSTEADGTAIQVFQNGSLLGTTTVTANAWILSGVSGLAEGDVITATATATGKGESMDNCDVEIVSNTCSQPPLVSEVSTIPLDMGLQVVVDGPVGTQVYVYNVDGTLFDVGLLVPGSSNPATTTTSPETIDFACQTANCFGTGTYNITLQEPGQCESEALVFCFGATPSAIPVITTDPVLISTTGITGTSTASATIYLYADDMFIASTVADGTGYWTINSLSFSLGEVITAKAIEAGNCISAASVSKTVEDKTYTPVITGDYCTATTISTITGFVTASSGTVQVLQNGTPHGSPATISANGTWNATGLSLVPTDTVTAIATEVAKLASDTSNQVIVGSATTNAIAITTNPVIEGSASVSGTGTDGDVITLYIDEGQIGATTIVAGGVWTVGGLAGYDLYAGGEVYATATTPGNCEGVPSTPVTVDCIHPVSSLTINPLNTTICEEETVDVTVQLSENPIIYQLYNGNPATTGVETGSSVLGDGLDITLTSDTLLVSAPIYINAFKISQVVCESVLDNFVSVTVNPLPDDALTVTGDTICDTETGEVTVEISESGIRYILRLDSDDSHIDTLMGSGSDISFSQSPVSTTTYNVWAEDPSTGCGVELSTPALITVNPCPSNNPPDALDDNASVDEDNTLNGGNLLTNDTDSDGDNLSINTTPVTDVTHGTLTISGDGTFTYDPDQDYNGPDSFEYEVCDDGVPSLCDTALVSLTVNAINDNPEASADLVTVDEDATNVYIDVQANDTDIDGDMLTTSIMSGPTSGGTASVVNGDSIQYTPPADFFGQDTIVYEICDAGPLCDQDTVFITVNNINDNPVAVDDNASVNEDNTLNGGNLLTNDTDQEGNNLSINTTPFTDVANGTLTINGDGTFTYDPDPDYNGSDSFEYEVCDDGTPSQCDVGLVTLTINPINDAPRPVNDLVGVMEDIERIIDVQANDIEVEGDPLTTSIFQAPQHGTANVLNGDSIRYTPDAFYSGSDTIIYQVCDNRIPSLCDTARVVIIVSNVNNAPSAVNDNVSVDEDNTLIGGNLLANDMDMDGNPLTINTTPVTDVTRGTLTINANGTFTYTPDPDYNGPDSFEYEVCDNGSPSLCDVALVSITVNAVNDAPQAVNDAVTVVENTDIVIDVQDNDSDLEGDALTTTIFRDPQHGTAVVISGVNIQYSPNVNYAGSDTIIYQVCDNGTPSLCDTARVVITITNVNNAPVAVDDVASVDEDNTLNGGNLLANDNDIEGNNLSINTGPVTDVQHGTLTIHTDGTFTYTPDPNYNGSDSFEYQVCDDGLPSFCDVGLVTLTVNAVNDAPVAADDLFETGRNPETLDVLANDTDVDGDALTLTIITPPDHGSASVSGSDIIYDANDDFCGTDQLIYEICDGAGLCHQAGVLIEIGPDDADNDNIPDALETTDTDTDNDGTPDYLDTDSDNDGIPDRIEGLTGDSDICNPVLNDSDQDGTPDYVDMDSDNDEIPDQIEAGLDPSNPVDTDNDGTPDYLDTDSDDDTKTDMVEGTEDCDNDGIPNYRDAEDVCEEVSVPEGFSPNNDGFNDFFVIQGIESYPNNKIMVFNRWGINVYEKENYQNDWDGKSMHKLTIGKDLPEGTYFYIVELGNGAGPIKGYVYLNR